MTEDAMPPSDPNFMLSLARGLSVLEAFSAVHPDVTIASLAARTGLPRSVVRRCLHTLHELGYIAAEGRSFTPRPRLLRIANVYLADGALPKISQPVIEQLRDEIGESCSVGVLDGDDVVYVARAVQPRLMNISLHTGSRLPAWCTSMGRILLAGRADTEIEAYLARATLVRRTEKTIINPDLLRRILSNVAVEGYALVDQEVERGLRSIAVPIHDRGGTVIAALNVGTSASHLSLANMKKGVLPRLLGAAKLIGEALPG